MIKRCKYCNTPENPESEYEPCMDEGQADHVFVYRRGPLRGDESPQVNSRLDSEY